MRTKKRELTDREEEFCQLIAKYGHSQTDAYQEAYGTENRKTARECACRIIQKPRIADRIDELKARYAYKIDWSKQKAELEVKDLYQLAIKNNNLKVALNCLQELNKMCGYYAPSKSVSINTALSDNEAKDVLTAMGYVKKELPAEVIDVE